MRWLSLSCGCPGQISDQYSEPQSQVAKLLVFPGSISISGQYFNEVGTLLLIVLAGALVGSEYSYGTHRLSLARGVGRGQLLAAQVIAVAILALIASGVTLLLGTIAGVFGGLALSGSSALSVAGAGELLGFWLAIALNTFAYALDRGLDWHTWPFGRGGDRGAAGLYLH